MSETCNHNCESCASDCKERTAPVNMKEPLHPQASVRKVIAVVSGKGGVGKSLVTSLLASSMQKKGYQTAVLDADITGPSIPKTFGVHGRAMGNEEGILPSLTKTGIQMMSVNLLLGQETDPVIWRGPIIANTVKQFWSGVIWHNVDYMFVDMPPGTGDVPLTVFQSIPVAGIIVVASPQELVSMIVEKAVKMAEMMDVPVLGLVENMSYFECPDCHKRYSIFGESHMEEIAARYGIQHTAKLPIDPELPKLCDSGNIEECEEHWLDGIVEMIQKM